MQTYHSTPFLDGFVFLEGPRWHADRLWVSDIWGETLYTVTEDGTHEARATLAGRPSGLGFLPDGTPLVVSMLERRLYRLAASGLELHADLSAAIAPQINDMVVDTQGRAYVGNMGYDLFGGAAPRPGEITLVEPDGRFRHVATGLDFPNGMLIKDDGRTLVVAESFGHRLSAFTIDADGGLRDQRAYATLPDLVPDGICLDRDGNIWVAGAMGGAFVLVDERGTVVARLDVAPRAAIACQLGGADGRTLYCLTYDGGIEELSQGVPGAHIETVRVDSPAAGSP